jgi:hypothetical protein
MSKFVVGERVQILGLKQNHVKKYNRMFAKVIEVKNSKNVRVGLLNCNAVDRISELTFPSDKLQSAPLFCEHGGELRIGTLISIVNMSQKLNGRVGTVVGACDGDMVSVRFKDETSIAAIEICAKNLNIISTSSDSEIQNEEDPHIQARTSEGAGELGFEHRELSDFQKAVMYGRRELANPGKDGLTRWRYTHDGRVFISDQSSRNLITSWYVNAGRTDASVLKDISVATQETEDPGVRNFHTVLVVDCSGSMRKADVDGHPTRSAAVYECLARDFIEPHCTTPQDGITHFVTLIEFADTAEVVFSRRPMARSLSDELRARANIRARSHGNYIPALDAALEALRRDVEQDRQLFLLFLSDGEPSDHQMIPCEHDVFVWQRELDGRTDLNRPALKMCSGGAKCRAEVKRLVLKMCLDRVAALGKLLGPSKAYVGTVAFGPPNENYEVLQLMAEQLPRGSFQKLALSKVELRTALSTLSSSLTSLVTASASKMTQRKVQMESDGITTQNGQWTVYRLEHVHSKQTLVNGKFVDCKYQNNAVAVALAVNCFAQVLNQGVCRPAPRSQ